jgi:hypothetical protein
VPNIICYKKQVVTKISLLPVRQNVKNTDKLISSTCAENVGGTL